MIYRSVHAEQAPVAKVAELKKLKTCASERQVLGPGMSSGAVSYLVLEYTLSLHKEGLMDYG